MAAVARIQRWQWLRVSLALLLLAMILMRLVWMQMRSYRSHVDPKAYLSLMFYEELAPVGNVNLGQLPAGLKLEKSDNPPPLGWYGSPFFRILHTLVGKGDNFNERFFIRNNQSLLMFLVFSSMMMVRFITSSWSCALIVGAVLMSRGKLLTAVGEISHDIPVTTLIAAYFAALAHTVRTASPVSLGAAVILLVVGVSLDGSLVGLALGMPLMLAGGFIIHLSPARLWVRRMRRLKKYFVPAVLVKKLRPLEVASRPIFRWSFEVRDMIGVAPRSRPPHRDQRVNLSGGGLLQTLRVPYLLWCFAQKRWLAVTLVWLFAAVTGMVLLVGIKMSLGSPEPVHWLAEGWLFDHVLATPWMLKGASYDLAPFVQHQGTGSGFWLWVGYWLQIQAESFDFHLVASLVILGLCLTQSPSAGFPGFLELCWMVVFGGLGLFAVAFLGDVFDEVSLQRLRLIWPETATLTWKARMPLDWLEPVILSLGIAGIYNLLRAMDHPRSRRSRDKKTEA